MKKIFSLLFISMMFFICLTGCGNNVMNEFNSEIEKILKSNDIEIYEITNEDTGEAGKFDCVKVEVTSSEFDELSYEKMYDIIKAIDDVEQSMELFVEKDILVTLNFKGGKNTFDRIIASDNKILTINDKIAFYKKSENDVLIKNKLLGVWNIVKTGNINSQTEKKLENHTFGFFESYPSMVYIDDNDEDYNGAWWIEDNKLVIMSAGKTMNMEVITTLHEMYWFFEDGSYLVMEKS